MKIDTENMDEILVVRPKGDLDALGYVSLVELLEEKIQEDELELVLDLSDVTYINSICVGYIVQFWRELTRGGGFFAISGARNEVRRLLEVGGVHRYINLYPDLPAAVRGCQEGESPKMLLDQKGLLDLVKNFARISLSRAMKTEVSIGEVAEAPDRWNIVRVSGELSGILGAVTGEASRKRIAGRMLEGIPGCEEVGAAIDHLERVLIDSALSGLEEVGYIFETSALEHGVGVDLPHSVALETAFGSVDLGIDISKIQTKRLRVQRRQS